MLRRLACVVLLIAMTGTVFAQQQTIYFKKDHIYNGPNGKEIAVVMPQPTDQTPPTAPTSLTIANSCNQGQASITATAVQLSWTGSTDNVAVAGYKVYRQQGSGANLPVATVTGTCFVDQPLTPSASYTWTVVAYDNAENLSTASNSVSTTTAASGSDVTPPSVPVNITGSGASGTTIQLNWDASTDTGGSGMAGYRVYRGGTLVASPTTNSYLDTGLTAKTSYSYTVAAVDNAGNASAQSSAVVVSTLWTPVFQDAFARADGDSGLVSGGWYASTLWTTLAHHATFPILSYTGWISALALPALSGDTQATVTITNNPNGAGIYFWDNHPIYYPATTWYLAYVTGTTLQLSYFNSSGENQLAHITVSSSLGTLSVQAIASSRVITVSYNGTAVITYTETDNTRPNNGRAGMSEYSTTTATSAVLFDNFILRD